MDKRKIVVEKGRTFYESLNSDELNLEIANNLENLFELRELVKLKARQSFDERKNQAKFLNFFKSAKSFESNPKYAYSIPVILWLIVYQVRGLPKVSFLFMIFGINIFYDLKRQNYCRLQEEFIEYKKLNDAYHQIIKLKKRSMKFDQFLYRTFGIDYYLFPDENKLKYIKFEYLS
jgi:hypothetical protein